MRTKPSPSKPAPVKGSPTKAKSPPKKSKEKQTLVFGQPYFIKYYRVFGGHLWVIANAEDKNDAFLKNLTDEVRNNPRCNLRVEFDVKGDLMRRVSLAIDEAMKNKGKGYERKLIYQCVDEEEAQNDPEAYREKTYQCGVAIQKVNCTGDCLLFIP